MDYIEYEIDSTYITVSDSDLSPRDNPVLDVGRTLTNVVAAKIVECNIPFSYYPVSDRPNVLDAVPENRMTVIWPGAIPVGGNPFIEIPPGFYTGTTLAATIQALLQTLVVGVYPLSFLQPATATCTFNSLTGKFTFQIVQAPGVGGPTEANLLFALSGAQAAQPLPLLLGFNGNFIPTVVTGGGTTFTWAAPNIATVTGPNCLYINSRILGNICKAYLPEGLLVQGENSPQMAMVPVNVNPGGVIWWQDPAPNELFDTRNLFSLQRLDFYITAGTDPRPISFNGLGFQLKLILYIKNPEQSQSQAGTVAQNRAVLQIRPT